MFEGERYGFDRSFSRDVAPEDLLAALNEDQSTG